MYFTREATCNFIFLSDSKNGKMGHFKKFEHKKSGHLTEKTRDLFENEKRAEIESLRFWGISNINAYDLR